MRTLIAESQGDRKGGHFAWNGVRQSVDEVVRVVRGTLEPPSKNFPIPEPTQELRHR